jgi:predicted O-methyltransferase YrrM/SAM-dependent methyltransferase
MNSHTSIDQALSYLKAGQDSEAFRVLSSASQEFPNERDLNLVWGMYFMRLGELSKALPHLQEEMRLHPSNEVCRQLLRDVMSGIEETSPRKGQVLIEINAGAHTASEKEKLAWQLRCSISRKETQSRVLRILKGLRADYWLERDIERYSYAAQHDVFWFEQITALNWFAKNLKPRNYLEVGVRRGRSMVQVAVESPFTQIYGFDLWIPGYGSDESLGISSENPGPEFILSELERLGVKHLPLLTRGDSHITLPHFFSDPSNPQLFDMITIDGDHSYEGAKLDLEQAFAHLAPGGVIIFDDIYHKAHPELCGLWHEFQERYPDFIFVEDRYLTGTGFAIKPPFDRISRALKAEKASKRLRILMPYSVQRDFGKITLPEWIKHSLEAHYSEDVEVFACGPGNEFHLHDSADFYSRVAELAQKLEIDAILDVEGGAESIDFMFGRHPIGVSLPKAFWAIDTHQFLSQQLAKAKHFDLVYSAQKAAVPAFGDRARWLPAGASLHETDFLRDRTIDVGFIGSLSASHTKRARIMRVLKQHFPQFEIHQHVFLEDKAELASRMKIVVNVSLNNDVNFRVFETMACGAMLITDKIVDNGLEDLFEDGKHLVTFETEEDLISKIRYFLSHDEERARIARCGQELVDRKYRHVRLLETVVNDLKGLCTQQTQAEEVRQEAAVARTCWCGGHLGRSVNPLYKACDECGTQVLERLYTEQELKHFYSVGGYWHDRQVNIFNFPPIEERAVNDFKDRIPVWHEVMSRYKVAPRRVMEIGCAHGGFLHYCRERGTQEVVGVEVDVETCRFAKSRFNLPHVVSGLFPKVDLPFRSFTAITGFDVIEHFIDPVEGLRGVSENLADDGICFFQTPWYKGQGEDWVQFKPAEHTFLYNERSIRLLFERTGLEVVDILPGYFKDDMFVIGKKKAQVSG